MCQGCEEFKHDSTKSPEISGAIFGVSFFEMKGDSRPNPQFRLFVEDDTLWHAKDFSASVFWLQDLRDVIDRAITVMKQRYLL